MFDDKTKEPEDIFAGSDAPTPAPGLVQPSAPNQAQRPAPVEGLSATTDVVTSGPNRTLVILIVVIVLLLIVVIGALVYSVMNRTSATPATNTTPTTQTQTNTQPLTPEQALPTIPLPTEPEPTPVTPVDTDKDGLADEEEASLRTNPTLVDSDEDGLSDADEVRVWKTDPLDSDTDNDGFPDGTEVKSGYDPLVVGGKLLNLPTTESSTSTNS